MNNRQSSSPSLQLLTPEALAHITNLVDRDNIGLPHNGATDISRGGLCRR